MAADASAPRSGDPALADALVALAPRWATAIAATRGRLAPAVVADAEETARRFARGEPRPGDPDAVLRAALAMADASCFDAASVGCAAGRVAAELERETAVGLRLAALDAQCCVAQLDLAQGRAVLEAVLDVADLLTSSVDSVVGAVRVAVASARSAHVRTAAVEAELLLAVTDAWDALGRTASALAALDAAIGALRPTAAPELALRRVELLSDLGAVHGPDGAVEVACAARERSAATPLEARWAVLEGEARHLAGDLTGAARCFGAALACRAGPLPAPLEREVRWRRAQVLVHLNRLDEAEADLVATTRAPAGGDRDRAELVGDLARARREGVVATTWTPPSPREVVGLLVETDAPSPPTPSSGPIGRTTSRGRGEWARWSAEIVLALSRGDVARAAEVFAPLGAWVRRRAESPLLVARTAFLEGLVAYSLGRTEEAEAAAGRALAGAEAMAIPRHAWASLCLLRWARIRRGAAPAEVADLTERLHRLGELVAAGLAPADAALYRLNKWSQVEDEMARICGVAADVAARDRRDPRRRPARATTRAVEGAMRALLPLRAFSALEGTGAIARRPLRTRPDGSLDVVSLAAEERMARAAAPWSKYGADAIRREAIGRDTAILQYVVLPGRTCAFLMTRAWARCVALPPRTRVELWHEARLAADQLRVEGSWRASGAVGALATSLGLEAVAAALPPRVNRIAVVTDDLLVHVPIAALPLGGAPLVHRFAMESIPSPRWDDRDVGPGALGHAVAVGVEESAAAAAPRLSGVHEELERVRAARGAGCVVLRDGFATRDAVVAAMAGADAIHLAAHGDLRPERPADSGVLLHDGWLTIDRLRGVASVPPVVVLSLCWGGAARSLPGRECVGLAEAFLHQGARWVVSSLWETWDLSAPDLMAALWARLSHEAAPAALAAVQRAASRTHPPRAWAAYGVRSAGLSPSPGFVRRLADRLFGGPRRAGR
ncbi:MAG: CHAT domain-containing protein [Planctomycetes bacterium]|nr:CHAT domain-containing protein [Planctomycetota bacterium]